MNEIADFLAKLRTDDYTEIETQNLEPRPPRGSTGTPLQYEAWFSPEPSS
jgi:hypothetical protein